MLIAPISVRVTGKSNSASYTFIYHFASKVHSLLNTISQYLGTAMTANVTITKIQHRVGNQDDLPQLDIGQFGFATDSKRLFIGNDPVLWPASNVTTTQTEILTGESPIPFNSIIGSANSALALSNPTDGQILAFTNDGGINKVINRGGNVAGNIDLGNVENVKIKGGHFNFVLETDGTGNLVWADKGTIRAEIISISNTSPAVMKIAASTPIQNRTAMTISGVEGTNTALINAKTLFAKLAVDFPTTGNVQLFNDTDLTIPFDATAMVATDNTGREVHSSYGKYLAGANTEIQFNDAGWFGAKPEFTFDKTSNTLTVPLTTTTLTELSNAQPNITSLGTLISLTVAGDSNLNDVYANNVTATNGIMADVLVANVANVGLLNVETTNANVITANTINSVLLGGTLTTAAQPNITSVGTLTGLAINGDMVISGNMTITGNIENVNVNTVNVTDPIIEQGGGANGAVLTANDGMDRGALLHTFDGSPIDRFMGWDNSASEFAFGSNVAVANNIVTFNQLANVRATTFIGNLVGSVTGNVTGNVTGDVTGNLIGGNTNSLVFQSSANVTAFTSSPTANTILQFDGTDYAWIANPTVALTNDTTTVTDQYPLFSDSTSGNLEAVKTSDTKYSYKASTGELKAAAHVSTNGITLNADSITESFHISTGFNGFSVGPMTLAPGATLTIAPGQRHVII
jgi:hypothetical protein